MMFRRFATAISTLTLLIGLSLVGAQAADAAALTPGVTQGVIRDAFQVGAHTVNFVAVHEGQRTAVVDGTRVYRTYTVSLNRAGHVFATVRNLTYARVLYVTATIGAHPGTSDTRLAGILRGVGRVDPHLVQIVAGNMLRQARIGTLMGDVANTTVQVTAWLTTNPRTGSAPVLNTGGVSERLDVTVNPDNTFTVRGYDTADKVEVTCDSITGKITVTKMLR